MYDADPEFRAAVNASTPDLLQLRIESPQAVGVRLEEQLLALMTQPQHVAENGAAHVSASSLQQPEAVPAPEVGQAVTDK